MKGRQLPTKAISGSGGDFDFFQEDHTDVDNNQQHGEIPKPEWSLCGHLGFTDDQLAPDAAAMSADAVEEHSQNEREAMEWEDKNWLHNELGSLIFPCGKCGKNRYINRDARRLATHINITCDALGAECRRVADDKTKRIVRTRKL